MLWRDGRGTPHLFDAHCPHQGAHLGHGGVVVGDLLKCPFHGWRLGADGACQAVPGAARVPQHVPLRAWRLIEQDGALLAWHGPDGRPPSPAPPPLRELREGWPVLDERRWEIASHVQEMLENLVDAAHFPGLHLTPGVPRTQFRAHGERATVTSQFHFDTLDGPVETTLESAGHGPGHWELRFTAPVPLLVLTTATPIDDRMVEFRLLFASPPGAAGAREFADSVIHEVEADRVVWEHKVYRPDPPLSEADGPIRAFREWFAQFHG